MLYRPVVCSTRALASIITVVGLLAVSASSASAGTDGQQVAFSLSYSNCSTLGPATNLTINGQNQNGTISTWRGGNVTFANGSYIQNWWWRGDIRVTWRDARTGVYHHTTAFIPQWDDKTFEMWNDVVTVDCHGSLRQVSTRVTGYATGGGIWACGGWRDGAGLTETTYYSGYDEYSSQYSSTSGIAGDGITPAIVTWKATAPNC